MFGYEKVFLGNDVLNKEELSRKLTESGTAITIVTTAGDQDTLHVLNSFDGVCKIFHTSHKPSSTIILFPFIYVLFC